MRKFRGILTIGILGILCFAIVLGAVDLGFGNDKVSVYAQEISDQQVQQLSGAEGFVKVASGSNHTLGLTEDGRLYGWGANTAGQVGCGTTEQRLFPTRIGSFVPGATRDYLLDLRFREIYARANSSWAISLDDVVYCWGENASSSSAWILGDGTLVNRHFPIQLGSNMPTATQEQWDARDAILDLRFSQIKFARAGTSISTGAVLSGLHFVQGITTDGRLFSWGRQFHGVLANGTSGTAAVSHPVQFGSGNFANRTELLELRFRDSFPNLQSYAITTDGRLFSWGENSRGALGHGNAGAANNGLTPRQVGYHMAAGATRNTVLALRFLDVSSASGWVAQANNPAPTTNQPHTLALTEGGRIWGWGFNNNGQIGNGGTAQQNAPVAISATNTFDSIRAMAYTVSNTMTSYSHAIHTDGRLFMWGSNVQNRLGDGTTTQRPSPTHIGGTLRFDQVWSSGASTFGLATDGRLFSWGANGTAGVLASGATTNNIFPTQVGLSMAAGAARDEVLALRFAKIISATRYTAPTFAICEDGRLFSWGNGTSGRHGIGTTASSLFPRQVGDLMVDGPERDHIMGLRFNDAWTAGFGTTTDGQLYGWGVNNTGRIGDGTTTVRHHPVLVDGSMKLIGEEITTIFAHRFIHVKAGMNRQFGILPDGRLLAWGNNANGVLGDGTLVNRTFPVQVGYNMPQNTPEEIALRDSVLALRFSMVAEAAVLATYAITTDGRLFAWGHNAHGVLGDGTTIQRLFPTQLGYHMDDGPERDAIMALRFADGKVIATRHGSPLERSVVFGITTAPEAGHLYSWGANGNDVVAANAGIAGRGSSSATEIFSIPARIGGTNTFTKVVPGSTFVHALHEDGRIFGWGWQHVGQIGNGEASSIVPSPIAIGAALRFKDIATGGLQSLTAPSNNTLAIATDGRLFAWGNNTSNGAGQLGDGTEINRYSPTQLGFNMTAGAARDEIMALRFVKAARNTDTSAAITEDGRIFTWGWGISGALGFGGGLINSRSPIPRQIGSNPNEAQLDPDLRDELMSLNFVDIQAHGIRYTAKTDDNRLFVWGNNGNGRLGDGTNVNSNTPTQIGYFNQNPSQREAVLSLRFAQFSTHFDHGIGITAGGYPFVWGNNSNGQLGTGDTLQKNDPYPDPVPLPQIGTPANIVIDNGILTWSPVENAVSYRVYIMGIGGQTITVDTNSLDFRALNLPDGVHRIRIRAVADGVYYRNSQQTNIRYIEDIDTYEPTPPPPTPEPIERGETLFMQSGNHNADLAGRLKEFAQYLNATNQTVTHYGHTASTAEHIRTLNGGVVPSVNLFESGGIGIAESFRDNAWRLVYITYDDDEPIFTFMMEDIYTTRTSDTDVWEDSWSRMELVEDFCAILGSFENEDAIRRSLVSAVELPGVWQNNQPDMNNIPTAMDVPRNIVRNRVYGATLDDRIWVPSSWEVGDGHNLWQLNNAERSWSGGGTWAALRSSSYPEAGLPQNLRVVRASGVDFSQGDINTALGVRPAVHLHFGYTEEWIPPTPEPYTTTWQDQMLPDTSWYLDNGDLVISTAEQLAGLAAIVNGTATIGNVNYPVAQNNFAGRTITLANDIDLRNRIWVPIGNGFITTVNPDAELRTFNGTFDGGHNVITVSNIWQFGHLSVDENQGTSGGVFGTIRDGVVRNLSTSGVVQDIVDIPDATLTGRIGGVIGASWGNTTLENIVNNVYINIPTRDHQMIIAGIVGSSNTEALIARNLANYGNIHYEVSGTTNPIHIGGILGFTGIGSSSVDIINSYNRGDIYVVGTSTSAISAIGGIFGWFGAGGVSTVINNSYNSGVITSDLPRAEILGGGSVADITIVNSFGRADGLSSMGLGTVTPNSGRVNTETGLIVSGSRTGQTLLYAMNSGREEIVPIHPTAAEWVSSTRNNPSGNIPMFGFLADNELDRPDILILHETIYGTTIPQVLDIVEFRDEYYLVWVAAQERLGLVIDQFINENEFIRVRARNDLETVDFTADVFAMTGQVIQLMDDDEILDQVICIVRGDLLGTGTPGFADIGMLVSHVQEGEDLEDDEFLAADILMTGTPGFADIGVLASHVQEGVDIYEDIRLGGVS